MKVEYKKVVTSDELAHLVPTKAGATFSQLWQILYYTRLFKYISYRHYQQIKPAFKKIATFNNLKELCRLGYLKSPQHEVYCATDKVLPLLEAAGYRIELLPQEPKGSGYINELNNTDVFVKLSKIPTFVTLLYPQFTNSSSGKLYLKPDALLIQHHASTRRYKLTFLEIEAHKPNWEKYIENKRQNYVYLSKDITFYNYWSSICPHLGFPKPDIKAIYFSVCFIGSIEKNFGPGFSFKNPLLLERRQ